MEAVEDETPTEHTLILPASSGDPKSSRLLGVPAGASRLEPVLADPARPRELVPAPREARAPYFVVAQRGAQDELMLVAAGGAAVAINGLPSPLVTPLAPGDRVVLPDGFAVYVSRRVPVGPVPLPLALQDASCGVCLGRFEADAPVVVCSGCGQARHADGEDVPEADRLECAVFGPCPECGCDAPAEHGLVWTPED